MKKELEKLIADEVEAVAGYNRFIAQFEGKMDVSKIVEIRNEELKHIAELNFLWRKL